MAVEAKVDNFQRPVRIIDFEAGLQKKRNEERMLAKGLLELSCSITGISVEDYASNFEVASMTRTKVLETANKLNDEIGSPISQEMFRSIFLLPKPQET